jgi:hypothetical protein
MDILGRHTIEDVSISLKYLKKLDKILKSNDFVNKYYQSGHVKLYARECIPIVEVWRLVDTDSENMEKATKDRITNFLKKNGLFYSESWGAYVYH